MTENMIDITYFLMFLFMLLLLEVEAEISPMTSCTNAQMRAAWMKTQDTRCRPRPTLVPVPVSESGHVILAPNMVEVMRCEGSCPQTQSASLSCLPGKVSYLTVPTMLSPMTVMAGVQETVCTTVRVEQHDTCNCGCHVTRDSCTRVQVYQPHLCQCSCDHEARSQCLSQGWHWDNNICECHKCPQPYPQCSTGYMFDYKVNCQCIQVHRPAFPIEEIVFVIFLLGFSCMVISLVQCYWRKVGLFKHLRSRPGADKLSQVLQTLNLDNGIQQPSSRVVLQPLNTIEEENVELLSVPKNNQHP